ncbi:MAG TPA: lysylphosphatidylglycerol synthase transmembrane domain-containing protein [Chthoniobacterales bacterium]|nr:lysylphosphatidylglycerol synthase transmembrane domain-containing protein [Chthoniobacterales bacterium]
MRRLKFVLRCIFSLALIALVLSKVNWPKLGAVLLRLDLRWAIAGWALSFLVIAGLALRWMILLKQQGLGFPFRTIFSLTWAGQFFNSILPGSTGGDLFKIFQLCRLAPERKAPAVATVVADRLNALGALIVLAAVGFAIEPGPLRMVAGERVSQRALLPALLALTCAGALGAWFVLRAFRDAPWLGKLHRTMTAAKTNFSVTPQLIVVVGLAFAIHVVNFSAVYLFARSLGIAISYPQVLLMMPVILFLVLIPVTINGHGLRELLLIGYLSYLHIGLNGNAPGSTQEIAVAWSFLLVSNDLLWSVPGGVLYLVSFRRAGAEPSGGRTAAALQ